MANKKNGASHNSHPKTRSLAKPGDPLVTASGEVVEPESDGEDMGQASQLVPPSTPVPFKVYRPISKRVMSDLRAPAQAVNVSAVVLVYTLLGLSDSELCEATGLSAIDVAKVRDSRIYSECFGSVMTELINANSEYIECRISAYSGLALNNVADIAQRAKNQAIKLAASKDLLDRAGHRPQDQMSRASAGLNELHIVITSPNDSVETKIDFRKGNQENSSRELVPSD